MAERPAERAYEPGLSEFDYYDILELAYEAKARAIAPKAAAPAQPGK